MDLYHITSQEILDRISRHCPDAMSAYLQCVNRADNDGNIVLSRKTIEIDMSEDFRMFRNRIKKLARENLLEWFPIDDGLSITLADNSSDHEDDE